MSLSTTARRSPFLALWACPFPGTCCAASCSVRTSGSGWSGSLGVPCCVQKHSVGRLSATFTDSWIWYVQTFYGTFHPPSPAHFIDTASRSAISRPFRISVSSRRGFSSARGDGGGEVAIRNLLPSEHFQKNTKKTRDGEVRKLGSFGNVHRRKKRDGCRNLLASRRLTASVVAPPSRSSDMWLLAAFARCPMGFLR